MSDDNLVSRLVDVLRRADRVAAYQEAGEIRLTDSAGDSLRTDYSGEVRGLRRGLRTVFFGLAMVLVAIFVFQIGAVGADATHRWTFFAAAGLLACIGAAHIDRGNRLIGSG